MQKDRSTSVKENHRITIVLNQAEPFPGAQSAEGNLQIKEAKKASMLVPGNSF